VNMLAVAGEDPKRLKVTADGLSHLRAARLRNDELGVLARALDRAFFKVTQREGRA
jgi:hypothetical protein